MRSWTRWWNPRVPTATGRLMDLNITLVSHQPHVSLLEWTTALWFDSGAIESCWNIDTMRMWPLQWQRVREFKNETLNCACCCCCSALLFGRWKDGCCVMWYRTAKLYWCSRSASYFGSSSSTWESGRRGYFSYYFLHNIFYLFFAVASSSKRIYAPPSSWRSGTDGSAYNKNRSPYTQQWEIYDRLLFFFSSLLLLCT